MYVDVSTYGGEGYTCSEREARANLRVHVMHLRRKLRVDGCRCYDIVAVRMAGYRLLQIGHDDGIQNMGQQR